MGFFDPRFFALVSLILSLAGAARIICVTVEGVTVSGDSAMYLFSASNLAQGKGLSIFSSGGGLRPLTDVPPLYPSILSLFFSLKLDPLAACRWLNVLLFAASVFLVGSAFRLAAPGSFWLPVAGQFVFLFSPSLWMIFGRVMSEPLFIALSLASLVSLSAYIERPGMAKFILCVSLTASAFLTRFIGISLVTTGVCAIIFFGRGFGQGFRSKARSAGLFLIASCLPVAAWVIRSWMLAGKFTSRQVIFHPVLAVRPLVLAVFQWLWFTGGRHAVIFLFLAAVAMAASFFMHYGRDSRRPAALTVYSLFIVFYGIFLAVSAWFVDASVQFNIRHIAPLLPVVLLVVLGAWHALALQVPVPLKHVLTAVSVVLMALFVSVCLKSPPIFWTKDQHRPSSFSSRLIALPADSVIFTDDPSELYASSRRWAAPLPQKSFGSTGRKNSRFEENMQDIGRLVLKRPVYAVFFPPSDPKLNRPEELGRYLRLRIVLREDGKEVYEAGK